MSENHTTVTKQETLAALRNPGELYVILSAATKQPFVCCDEETYDDEVFLYYRAEDAKEQSKRLAGEQYATAVAKLESKQLLPFYTSLYTMGVNCLSVNHGTDTQISVQLSELVTRKVPEQLPKGQKLIENPALQLTAMYFMQEMRRQAARQAENQTPLQPTEALRELQEELLAHYNKGTFVMVAQEDGQTPLLKQKDGTVYQPVFTDMMEVQRFAKGQKIKTLIVPAAKIPELLVKDATGVVINPFGVNVQLRIEKKKPETGA